MSRNDEMTEMEAGEICLSPEEVVSSGVVKEDRGDRNFIKRLSAYAQNALTLAFTFLNRGKFADAKEQFLRYLSEDPTNYMALYFCSLCDTLMGKESIYDYYKDYQLFLAGTLNDGMLTEEEQNDNLIMETRRFFLMIKLACAKESQECLNCYLLRNEHPKGNYRKEVEQYYYRFVNNYTSLLKLGTETLKKLIAIQFPRAYILELAERLSEVLTLANVKITLREYEDVTVQVQDKWYEGTGYHDERKRVHSTFTPTMSVLQKERCERLSEEIKNVETYYKALDHMDANRYLQAWIMFKKLGEFGDSKKYAEKCEKLSRPERYEKAKKLYQSGKYKDAEAAFKELGNYEDSCEYVKKCQNNQTEVDYQSAIRLYNSGNYHGALAQFYRLGGYRDSQRYVTKCQFHIAEQIKAEKRKWSIPMGIIFGLLLVVGVLGALNSQLLYSALPWWLILIFTIVYFVATLIILIKGEFFAKAVFVFGGLLSVLSFVATLVTPFFITMEVGSAQEFKVIDHCPYSSYVLTADIDFNEEYVGTHSGFIGTLNGNGYTIKNANAKNAFFRFCNGTLENVTFENIQVEAPYSAAGDNNLAYSGVVCATSNNGRFSQIEIVNSSIRLNSDNDGNASGGLCGYLRGAKATVARVHVKGLTIDGVMNESFDNKVGGVIGWAELQQDVSECSAVDSTLKVQGAGVKVGGLFGFCRMHNEAEDEYKTLENCYVHNVTFELKRNTRNSYTGEFYNGGLVGEATYIIIKHSYTQATSNESKYRGLVGYASYRIIVEECYYENAEYSYTYRREESGKEVYTSGEGINIQSAAWVTDTLGLNPEIWDIEDGKWPLLSWRR